MDNSKFTAEVAERQEWLLDMWRLQHRRGGLPGDNVGLIKAGDGKAIRIAQVRPTGPGTRRLQHAVATRQAKDDAKRSLEALLRSAEEEEAERRKGKKRRRTGLSAGSRLGASSPSPAPEDGEEEGRDPPFLLV